MTPIHIIIAVAFCLSAIQTITAQSSLVDIGSQRELFVDYYLIERLDGTLLKLHKPKLTPFTKDSFRGSYNTVIKDNLVYRRYYRELIPGYQGEQYDGHPGEYTAYAESKDGIHWSKPNLRLYKINGSWNNNAILADSPPFSHNFSPFRDTRPNVSPNHRYKALAGVHKGGGLMAFVSMDGIHWSKLQKDFVITSKEFAFDSQNVSFWSDSEQLYVCYYRAWKTPHGRLRSINRISSKDYLVWSNPVALAPNAPNEHLYTSQTHPYFRAPHIYIAFPTRYLPNRGSSTDILFMTMRAGASQFTRVFREALIRPGLELENWGNRSNYAALNIVPTKLGEMSIYVRNRRYILRTDGFVSVNAPYEGGELLTVPLTFEGSKLEINYATSAAGNIRVEIQTTHGQHFEGYSLEDCDELLGDQISRIVTWNGNSNLGKFSKTRVRLRFQMKDADLFSIRFQK